VAVWATKVVDSTTVRLPAGTEDLLDLVVGPVVQVGLVLLVGSRLWSPRWWSGGGPGGGPGGYGGDRGYLKRERPRRVTRTETQSGHGTSVRCKLHPTSEVPVGGYDSLFRLSPLFLLAFLCLSVYGGLVSKPGDYGLRTVDKASIHSWLFNL